MSAIYKFTAWWGGQEGSLLLWHGSCRRMPPWWFQNAAQIPRHDALVVGIMGATFELFPFPHSRSC